MTERTYGDNGIVRNSGNRFSDDAHFRADILLELNDGTRRASAGSFSTAFAGDKGQLIVHERGFFHTLLLYVIRTAQGNQRRNQEYKKRADFTPPSSLQLTTYA
jgi:hypothetical protein